MRPVFAPDAIPAHHRVGLVYMASSTVMEPEMYAMAARGVSIHTSRLTLPAVTVEGIDAMMRSPELETAARLVAQAPLDALVFGGTSASFLHGTAWDRALVDRMTEWSGLPGRTTTTSTASLAALKAVGAGPITLVTPYVPEVIARAERFFGENGHPVLASRGLSVTDDHALAEIPLEQVFELAVEVDVPEASAVFISCTNLHSVGVIAALEAELGKPVISAVQASFWHCLELVDVDGAAPGYGSLFDGRLAHGADGAP
ncbi:MULTISPECIES: Asp/Glu racemase [Actinoalloteichus]|uniref:Maleate cis-trans isomerase n=1 Tax=Actinoalloteichus fjordicus TaxID=1612552 RepID=A0AAC9LG39_9PSEU|nr:MULTISPECIES: Asp/Glu racemase [Actinoalloteichus]APU16127.1 maleate cis-trans isomerase [Actinoalloteichus fjordicus]APU22190.1 maleate cis-trans isomerase [Actinoalloteichus sp. GBA129-24]